MNGPAVTVTALARRADAGTVRLGLRDVAGLVLAGDMYGAPYDLLAAYMGVRPDRLRAIVPAGAPPVPGHRPPGRRAAVVLADPAGLGAAGAALHLIPAAAAGPPGHIRAVLAVRLALEAGNEFAAGWRGGAASAASAPPPG